MGRDFADCWMHPRQSLSTLRCAPLRWRPATIQCPTVDVRDSLGAFLKNDDVEPASSYPLGWNLAQSSMTAKAIRKEATPPTISVLRMAPRWVCLRLASPLSIWRSCRELPPAAVSSLASGGFGRSNRELRLNS